MKRLLLLAAVCAVLRTIVACLVLCLLATQADARGSGGSRLGRGHSHVSTSVHTHSR
jgi:hypothetical protein